MGANDGLQEEFRQRVFFPSWHPLCKAGSRDSQEVNYLPNDERDRRAGREPPSVQDLNDYW